MTEPNVEIVVKHNCQPFDWQKVSVTDVQFDVDTSFSSTTYECGGTDLFDFSRDLADIYIDENGCSIKLDNEGESTSDNVYINKYGQIFRMPEFYDLNVIDRLIEVLKCAKGSASPQERPALDKNIAILIGIQATAVSGHYKQCGPDIGFDSQILDADRSHSEYGVLCEEGVRFKVCDYFLSSTGVIAGNGGMFNGRFSTEWVRQKMGNLTAQYPEMDKLKRVQAFLDSALSEPKLFPVSGEFPYQVEK